jgi:hypothetical protein
MSLELMFPNGGLVAGLSEGQRPIAHLVIVLGLLAGLALFALVRLIRGKARRRDQSDDREQKPEEH